MKLSETKAETDKDGKTKSLISRTDRYKCAVTNDILRNTTTLFVLKPTGAYQEKHLTRQRYPVGTQYVFIAEVKVGSVRVLIIHAFTVDCSDLKQFAQA